MAFALLLDDTLYKEVAPNPAGHFVNYEWVEFDNTFTTFNGVWSPYREGETSLTLPEGISSSDAIIIHSTEVLATDDSSIGNESTGQRIYLSNPEVNIYTHKYLVRKLEVWNANSSFSLIPTSYEYMATRERAT